MQARCARTRNRKRSKRRAIYCPTHGCYLDSVSQKHRLYADNAQHLRQRGMSYKRARLLVASRSTISLDNEWLEAFWCPDCQETRWYHIHRQDSSTYHVMAIAPELWKQASGVIQASGNPTVGEFSYRHARRPNSKNLRDFRSQ